MSFLVDANVVSEWVKPRPNPGIVAWLADTNEDQVFLSVVSHFLLFFRHFDRSQLFSLADPSREVKSSLG
jgi:predicted nucleic acid-binding protein